ncbi:MAG: hypothetical protein LUG21_01360 [Clostridiales bacterium]|nr:hypothetical protein [Clostridiales bacterium]
MKLFYEKPEMEIRSYNLTPDGVITTSGGDTDLGDGEKYPITPVNDYFE